MVCIASNHSLRSSTVCSSVAYILRESYQRFLTPIEIGTAPTLVIALGGLVVNVGSVFILQGGEMSLNEKGAFYRLLGDAGGSIAVIASVGAIEATGMSVLDPITAVLIASLILWSAGKMLRGSGAMFFLKTPFDTESVRTAIEAIEGSIGLTICMGGRFAARSRSLL